MFGFVSKNELKLIDEYFEQYIKFTQYKQNKFDYIEKTGNKELDELFAKWNHQIKQTDISIKSDINVIGEIVLTTDKVNQGIFKCRVKSDTKNPMISTLKKTVNQMLDSLEDKMTKLESALNAYANDDFRATIDIDPILKDRMLAVMSSINSLGITLGSNAKDNLNNGKTLQKNSQKMSASMNNLATKANEQAASLEQTAAAVEEITSITRNNTINASKMAELGMLVKDSVSAGQTLAHETVTSMEEINKKVSAINDSINIIDQIAFQTNILSLNAAEVRNLASRSAEAAREIKKLVEDANLKANQGKTISDSMINGYTKLNEIISQTINIIEDVSSASKEQMQGIEQINVAINMLDKVTQENAHEANNTAQIGINVETLAKQLVNEANSKKFN